MKKYFLFSIILLTLILTSSCKKIISSQYTGIWELTSVTVTNYDTLTLNVLSTNTTHPIGKLILNKDSSFVATSSAMGIKTAYGIYQSGTWGVKTNGKLAILYLWKGTTSVPDVSQSADNPYRNMTVTKKTLKTLQYETFERTEVGRYLKQKTTYTFKRKSKPKKGDDNIENECNGMSFIGVSSEKKCLEIKSMTIEPYNSSLNEINMTFATDNVAFSMTLFYPITEGVVGNYTYSSALPDDSKKSLYMGILKEGSNIIYASNPISDVQITDFTDDGVSYVVKGKVSNISFSENSTILGGNEMKDVVLDFLVAK